MSQTWGERLRVFAFARRAHRDRRRRVRRRVYNREAASVTTLAASSTSADVHDFFDSETWYASATSRSSSSSSSGSRRRLGLQGRAPADRGSLARRRWRRCSGSSRRSSARSSTCSSGRPEYLEDVRERELEIKAMEERLALARPHCPVCRAEIERDVPRLPGLHDEAEAGLRRTARRRSRRSGRSARTARRRSSPRAVEPRDLSVQARMHARGADPRRRRRDVVLSCS